MIDLIMRRAALMSSVPENASVQSGELPLSSEDAAIQSAYTFTVTGAVTHFLLFQSATPATAAGARFIGVYFDNESWIFGVRTNSSGSSYAVGNNLRCVMSEGSVTVTFIPTDKLCPGYTYTWYAW